MSVHVRINGPVLDLDAVVAHIGELTAKWRGELDCFECCGRRWVWFSHFESDICAGACPRCGGSGKERST